MNTSNVLTFSEDQKLGALGSSVREIGLSVMGKLCYRKESNAPETGKMGVIRKGEKGWRDR